MKRLIFILCFSILLATPIFAQQDSTFRVILKINPLEDLMAAYVGEIGATLQLPVKDSTEKVPFISFIIGGGYNIGPDNAQGFTARTGFYRFFGKKSFITFQIFYRDWFSISNVDAGYNIILDPTTFMSAAPDLNGFSVEVDNARVKVYDANLSYGQQFPFKKSKGSSHSVFEWYIGLGLRTKSIEIEELGTLHNSQFYPKSSPTYAASYSSTYPYVKLGFMFGYKL